MVIPPLLLDDDDDDGEEVRNVSASVGDGRAKRRERMATMVEEILLARMCSFVCRRFPDCISMIWSVAHCFPGLGCISAIAIVFRVICYI